MVRGNGYVKFEANAEQLPGLTKVKALLVVNNAAVGVIQRLDVDGIPIFRKNVSAGSTIQVTFKGEGIWLKNLLYQEAPSDASASLFVYVA